MFNLYNQEMPNQKKITKTVQGMMADSQNDLWEIGAVILDHILEAKGIDPDKPENKQLVNDATSIANEAMLDVISELEVNENNAYNLMDYSEACTVWQGLNRLINDFDKVLPEEERQRLIDEYKDYFIDNLTEHWK